MARRNRYALLGAIVVLQSWSIVFFVAADEPPPETQAFNVQPVEQILPPPCNGNPLQMFGAPLALQPDNAVRYLNIPTSSQRYNRQYFDYQKSRARPMNATLNPELAGYAPISFFGTTTFAKPALNARSDVVVDSTKMTSSSIFAPNSILVNGQPFFGSGARATLLGQGSVIGLDTKTPTAYGTVRVYYENDFVDLNNGERFGYRLRHLYGQAENVVFGQTYSAFSDADAIPEQIGRINNGGPHASMFILQPQIGYLLQTSVAQDREWLAQFNLEQPNAEPRTPTGFGSVSRVPDFAAYLRYQDKQIGHVQVASVLRSIGIENGTNTIEQDVLGWGVYLSGSVRPFYSSPSLQTDTIMAGFTYGEGIARYNVDLRSLGNDAAFDASGILLPLPLTTCYIGYTHYWTSSLRSTAIYSHVNLDSLPSQGSFATRETQLASINFVYDVPCINGLKLAAEYLYGRKRTLNGARGEAHRGIVSIQYWK